VVPVTWNSSDQQLLITRIRHRHLGNVSGGPVRLTLGFGAQTWYIRLHGRTVDTKISLPNYQIADPARSLSARQGDHRSLMTSMVRSIRGTSLCPGASISADWGLLQDIMALNGQAWLQIHRQRSHFDEIPHGTWGKFVASLEFWAD
jgi:hypothetical protein